MTESSLVSMKGLGVHFADRGGAGYVHAVCDVDLQIAKNSIMGIVGESGSGKSTLVRALAGTGHWDSGEINWHDSEVYLTDPSRQAQAYLQRRVQMVFQDPASSLNPRRRVGAILDDALTAARKRSPRLTFGNVQELLQLVDLPPSLIDRWPRELSGGQQQRVSTARAVALGPDVLVWDEAVSSLDVLVQDRILGLVHTLQRDAGVTSLFVTHDISVLPGLADTIAVMYAGHVVEFGDTNKVLQLPEHPYTDWLISCVPSVGRRADWRGLADDVVSPSRIESCTGPCRFRDRCDSRIERCDQTVSIASAASSGVGRSTVSCNVPRSTRPAEWAGRPLSRE